MEGFGLVSAIGALNEGADDAGTVTGMAVLVTSTCACVCAFDFGQLGFTTVVEVSRLIFEAGEAMALPHRTGLSAERSDDFENDVAELVAPGHRLTFGAKAAMVGVVAATGHVFGGVGLTMFVIGGVETPVGRGHISFDVNRCPAFSGGCIC